MDEPCDGPSTCHGPQTWCDRCGDVLTACNATRCDRHQCQRCRRFLSRAEHDHEHGELYKECTDCLMAQPISDTHPAWVRFCTWFVLGDAVNGPRVLSTSAASVASWSDELLGEAFESAELVMVVLEAHGFARGFIGYSISHDAKAATVGVSVESGRNAWATPHAQMFREGLMLLVQRFGAEVETRRRERSPEHPAHDVRSERALVRAALRDLKDAKPTKTG